MNTLSALGVAVRGEVRTAVAWKLRAHCQHGEALPSVTPTRSGDALWEIVPHCEAYPIPTGDVHPVRIPERYEHDRTRDADTPRRNTAA